MIKALNPLSALSQLCNLKEKRNEKEKEEKNTSTPLCNPIQARKSNFRDKLQRKINKQGRSSTLNRIEKINKNKINRI